MALIAGGLRFESGFVHFLFYPTRATLLNKTQPDESTKCETVRLLNKEYMQSFITSSNGSIPISPNHRSLPFYVRLFLQPVPPMLPTPKLPKAPPLTLLAGVSLVGLVTLPREPL